MDKKRVGQIKEQFDLAIHGDETAKIEFWYGTAASVTAARA